MGLALPFGISVLNPEPLEKTRGPFASLVAAKAGTPIGIRHDGMTVMITGLGEYWWEDPDFTDSGLHAKTASTPSLQQVLSVSGIISADVFIQPNTDNAHDFEISGTSNLFQNINLRARALSITSSSGDIVIGATGNIKLSTGAAGGTAVSMYGVDASGNLTGGLTGLGAGMIKHVGTNATLSVAVAGTDYQAPVSLTTTGSSGAATFIGNILNIPQYGAGTITGGSNGLSTSGANVILGGTTTSNNIIDVASGFVTIFKTAANANNDFGQFGVTNLGTNDRGAYLRGTINNESFALNFGKGSALSVSPGAVFIDNRTAKAGIEYSADGYVTNIRSLTDRGYADTHLAGYDFTNSPSLNYVPSYNGTNITWNPMPTGTITGGANGLSTSGANVILGGSLVTSNVLLDGTGAYPNFTIQGMGVTDISGLGAIIINSVGSSLVLEGGSGSRFGRTSGGYYEVNSSGTNAIYGQRRLSLGSTGTYLGYDGTNDNSFISSDASGGVNTYTTIESNTTNLRTYEKLTPTTTELYNIKSAPTASLLTNTSINLGTFVYGGGATFNFTISNNIVGGVTFYVFTVSVSDGSIISLDETINRTGNGVTTHLPANFVGPTLLVAVPNDLTTYPYISYFYDNSSPNSGWWGNPVSNYVTTTATRPLNIAAALVALSLQGSTSLLTTYNSTALTTSTFNVTGVTNIVGNTNITGNLDVTGDITGNSIVVSNGDLNFSAIGGIIGGAATIVGGGTISFEFNASPGATGDASGLIYVGAGGQGTLDVKTDDHRIFYDPYGSLAITSDNGLNFTTAGQGFLDLGSFYVGIFGDYGITGQALISDGAGGVVWGTTGGGGVGDMLLGTAQTNIANKTFLNSTLLLRNVADTFSASFTNTITSNRTYTLPNASGTIALTTDIPTFDQVLTAGSTLTNSYNITGAGHTLTFNNTGSFGTSIVVSPTVTTISNNFSVFSLSPTITTSTPLATSSLTMLISNSVTFGAASSGHIVFGVSPSLIDGGFNNTTFVGNSYNPTEIFTGSGTKHYAQLWQKGKVGFIATPTAMLHLKAGTATAETAPLKFNTGTALTTPEDGALEYHTSHLYFTIGSTRYQLDQQAGGGSTTFIGLTDTPASYASQSLKALRVNAGETALEFYTPSGGGGGITNGAANNEMMKSDGTNAVASGLGSLATGNLDLGLAATAGASRVVTANGSASDIDLTMASKGNGTVYLTSLSTNNGIILQGAAGSTDLRSNAASFTVMGLTSGTGSVNNSFKIRHDIIGTPTAGVGVGIQFETLTSAATYKVGSQIESVSTDVTVGTQDFDLVFKTMQAGATASEKMRLKSTGDLSIGGGVGTSGQVLTSNGAGAAPTWQTGGGGGGGITNGAAVNEMMKSDGTNAVPSEVFSTTGGSLILGSTATGVNRVISAVNSAGTASMILQPESFTTTRIYLNCSVIEYGEPSAVGSSRTLSVSGIDADIAMSFSAKGTGGFSMRGNGLSIQSNGVVTRGGMSLEIAGENMIRGTRRSDNTLTPFSIVASAGSSTTNNGDDVKLIAGAGFTVSGNGAGGNAVIQSGLRRTAGIGLDGKIVFDPRAGWIEIPNTTTIGTVTADRAAMYVADITASNAAMHFKTENGQVIKLYQTNSGSSYAISNVTTDRAYDANSTTLDELADVLGSLIADLKLTGLIV